MEGAHSRFRRVLAAVARPLLGVALGAALVAGVTVPAQAAADPKPSAAQDLVPSEGAYFGSILDWSSDSVADQADRLGSPAAVYQHEAGYPMTAAEKDYVRQFFSQTASAGAVPLLAIRPSVALSDLTEADAERLVDDLEEIAAPSGAGFWLSFAPDMNVPWVEWGQRPDDYRAAFTQLADVVHERLPGVGMLWSPFWGGDYPFSGARAASGALAAADTDSDGDVDGSDDPYAPYYPGDDVVDGVGLSVYHDSSGGGSPVNTVPADGEFVARLTGSDGAAPDFYGTYTSAARPLLVETAAFSSPAAGGPGELAIKQAWWQQIEAAIAPGQLERLRAVVWRDTGTTRGAVGETVIDWSITLGSAAVRDAFRASLADAAFVLGPVREPVEASAAGSREGLRLDGVLAWVVVAVVAAGIVVLTVAALRRRSPGRLAYSGSPARDARIDLLRGMAIVFVVINHVGLVSLLQDVTQEFLGVVSGAELFVLLSGAVLGLVYRPKLVSGGIGEVIIRTGQRAWKLYYTALAVVVLIFFLALIPVLNGTVVTTFTDQGTGAAGQSATGRVYDLYASADALLRYPVDPHAVVDFLLLRMGPWQFNVMGLYVVLLVVSPLVLWALGRRWWPWVLGISLALYVVGLTTRFRLLPSQFEDSFPLLVWQLLFVGGMTAGFYRREIIAWFSSRAGKVVLCALIAVAAVLMVFSWNNPYTSSSLDVRLAIVPDNVFRAVYGLLFERTYLEPGRLLNVIVLLVALYALLTAYWRPIKRTLGWFLIPLGQATLYVFIMHVFFVLIAASIPILREGNVWINTLANLVILALLWVMVRTRFLFRLVPR